MSAAALTLRGVTKNFGGVVALDGVDLQVMPGEILALVGPNGAGKSVLVNVITGVYEASAGVIRIGDCDVSNEPSHRRARLGMARTFQNIRLFRRMTVVENVLVAIKQHARQPFRSLFHRGGKRDLELAMTLLEQAGLAAKADESAGALAYGEARRLEIARALAGDPQLLLLDEPAAGMNDRETEDLASRIDALRNTVPAIVVIEHDMGFLRGLCDRMAVLDYGRKIADGPVSEVLANSRVVEAYLGAEE
jgi:branched-chain amino acid transport system ATP-binding protein